MSKPRPPTTNPVEYTFGADDNSIPYPEPVSADTYYISGTITTVFGLKELPPSTTDVAVIWMLHPRLESQKCMAPFAAHFIAKWNAHNQSGKSRSKKGLIAVAFDQRNHGSRVVSAIANEAWRNGNEKHAQDMWSSYHGTAVDTSLLMDLFDAYVFPDDDIKVVQHICLGISLGGYAAWQCLMREPRFSSAIITIGCPDYLRVMSDRARLSKRKTWLESQGQNFFGSRDFPPGLLRTVERHDPAAMLWSKLDAPKGQEHLHFDLSAEEKERVMPIMVRALGNKRVLNLAGGADKLVPLRACEPFLTWLKKVSGKGAWFEGSGFHLEDISIPGLGHEVPAEMVDHMVRFLLETLDDEQEAIIGKRGSRESRI